ncbi:MAG: hypothetical protein ACJAYU_005048 [Bradymonadia bacterium]|jgi:hypothetical protein
MNRYPALPTSRRTRATTRFHLFLLLVPLAACGNDAGVVRAQPDAGADSRPDVTVDAVSDAESDANSDLDSGADWDADSNADGVGEDAGEDSDIVLDPRDGGPDVVPDSREDPDAEPPTCEEACVQVVDCLIDLCDGFEEGERRQLSNVCAEQCTPDRAEQLSSQTCEENVEVARDANPAAAAACEEPEPVDGLNALYIGHSFGRPFADRLPDVASSVGVAHSQEVVMRGGERGAPQALWDDLEARAEAQGLLDEGDVDVLIMICCSESFLEDGSDAAIPLWIDYALAQNPSTRFVLALPWPDFPEEYANGTEYAELWHGGHEVWHDLIDSLRASYPGVEISCLPHGRAALELRHLFEAGDLSDVDTMTSSDGAAIFRDRKGHADEILLDLGSLIWLGSIYDVDISTHPLGEEYELDLIGIAETILAEDDHIR